MQVSVRTQAWSAAVAMLLAGVSPLAAQDPQQKGQEDHSAHQKQDESQDHAGHQVTGASLFTPRDASGTSVLPQLTPMYGAHMVRGRWELMIHGVAYGQFLYESGDHGDEQGGSINWGMAMARRPVAGGTFGLRGMVSLEPWTIPGCGYPDLLASGEVCDGAPIHDRQHPHDLFMELAAEYERPLAGTVRWQVYGGAAGEPALGPVAFPHRSSAQPNPLAPISHHWLDATHVSFGVVTAGIHDRRWKAEASVFNGREPDSERLDLDLAAMDSFSGRLWWLPTDQLAFQVSIGHLEEAEADHHGGTDRTDVRRMTASATYHRLLGSERVWASTVAWGRNTELSESTNAVLVESSVDDGNDAWFGRFEVAEKSSESLDIHGAAPTLTVAKGQAGYTRYLGAWKGMSGGIGGAVSLGVVPASAQSAYGRRANPGFSLFVTLRPNRHRM
jgi:hypothetical protein